MPASHAGIPAAAFARRLPKAAPCATRRPCGRLPGPSYGLRDRLPRHPAGRRCARPGMTPGHRSVRRENPPAPMMRRRSRRRSAVSRRPATRRCRQGEFAARPGAGAHETHDVVAALHQCLHRGTTDRAGRPENEHAGPAARVGCHAPGAGGIRAPAEAAGVSGLTRCAGMGLHPPRRIRIRPVWLSGFMSKGECHARDRDLQDHRHCDRRP